MAHRPAHALVDDLQHLVDGLPAAASARVVCEVALAGSPPCPVHAITLGSADPALPALGVFGGVHGLERIGTEVALAFVRTLLHRLPWDESLHHLLQGLRIVVMPLVNPGGLLRGTRANPQGVDLMRNAPVTCRANAPWLLGGQRLGPRLPWYRGPAGAPMAAEAQALCRVVEEELFGRPCALAIDCHSGFGLTDRLWFPHAHTAAPVDRLPDYLALGRLLDDAVLHHRYVVEPQSRQYLAHGDLWDHLYLQSESRHAAAAFLPLTLEMGSWLWVKKNPRQAFSRHGIFNPLIEHRQQRVLRRHLGLLDFAMRAAHGHRRWLPAADEREPMRDRALARWYRPATTA